MDYESGNEDGQSSLSDSTYEIISESSFRTEDDESDTHNDDGSLMSYGERTPSEGSILDEEEVVPQHQSQLQLQTPEPSSLPTDSIAPVAFSAERDQDEAPPTPEQIEIEQQLSTPSLNLSSMHASTVRPGATSLEHVPTASMATNAWSDSREVADWITFQEPTRVADGLYNIPEVVRAGVPTAQAASIRPDPSRGLLKFNGTVRVFYHGSFEFQQAIVEKIAQALSLSVDRKDTNAQIMNAVPVSAFGNSKAEQQFVLIHSPDLQLSVIDCHHSPSSAQCCTRSRAFGSTLLADVMRWRNTLDLAVFVHPTSGTAQELRASLCLQQECSIPVLAMSEDAMIPSDVVPPFSSTDGAQFAPAEMQHSAMEVNENGAIRFPIPFSVQEFLDTDSSEINYRIASLRKASANSLSWNAIQVLGIGVGKLFALYMTLSCFSVFFIAAMTERAYQYLSSHVLKPTMKHISPFVRQHQPRVARYLDGMHVVVGVLAIFATVLGCYTVFGKSNDAIFNSGSLPSFDTEKHYSRATVALSTPSSTESTPLVSAVPRIITETSLSRVDTQTGLTIVPSMSTKISNFLFGQPEIKLAELQDGRWLLQSSEDLEWPAMFLFGNGDGLVESLMITKSEVMIRGDSSSSISRVNSSALEIYLPRNPYCGEVNVTVLLGGAHRKKSRHRHSFMVGRPCKDVAYADEWWAFYSNHILARYEDAKRAVDVAARQVQTLQTTIRPAFTAQLFTLEEGMTRLQEYVEGSMNPSSLNEAIEQLRQMANRSKDGAFSLYRQATDLWARPVLRLSLKDRVKAVKTSFSQFSSKRRARAYVKLAKLYKKRAEKRASQKAKEVMRAIQRMERENKRKQKAERACRAGGCAKVSSEGARKASKITKRQHQRLGNLAQKRNRNDPSSILGQARIRASKTAEKLKGKLDHLGARVQQLKLKEMEGRVIVAVQERYEVMLEQMRGLEERFWSKLGLDAFDQGVVEGGDEYCEG